jgi:rubredoxin
MRCPLPDDFNLALDALAGADAYVVVAPAYVLGANASLKLFLDRALSFYGALDALWGKPAAGVAIAGIEGMEGYTKLSVDSFIKLTFGDMRGSEVLYGALPGEIFIEDDGKGIAKKLANLLINGLPPAYDGNAGAPSCPTCGGDTFRFLPKERLRCMLCSNSGAYEWREGRLSITMTPRNHQLFLDYESARRHLDWLRSMKERFLAKKAELKSITADYIQMGEWVRPERLTKKDRNE